MIGNHFLNKIVLTLIGLICFTFSFSQIELKKEKEEALMRTIGDAVLSEMLNDSTSLVLPIQYEKGKYSIVFQRTFELDPRLLVDIVNRKIKAKKFDLDYLLEVQDVNTEEIVYSYEMDSVTKTDLIPCQSRVYPESKYRILISFPIDFSNETPVAASFKWYIISIVAFFTLTIFLVFFILKRPVKKNDNTERKVAIGTYHFDDLRRVLIHPETTQELSSKECDLLLLLLKNKNETVERERILNEVWGDEGDYVGRTLDVFISKLRKKLNADPNVKIDNIRGVGYKLVVLEDSDTV